MKKNRGAPANTKMGQCIHIRLTKATEQALRKTAQEKHLCLATYIRCFIEDAYTQLGLN